MGKRAVWLLGLLLSFLAGVLACLNGCGAGSSSAPPAAPKIQHVVVIFQENRSPDNLFHGLPNADIANSGLNSRGQTIALTPVTLAIDYNPDHSHSSFTAMYDDGKMDGADKIPVSCQVNAPPGCPPPNPQFVYVNPSD